MFGAIGKWFTGIFSWIGTGVGLGAEAIFNAFLDLIPVIDFGIAVPLSMVIEFITDMAPYISFFVPLKDYMNVLTGMLLFINAQLIWFVGNWMFKRVRGG